MGATAIQVEDTAAALMNLGALRARAAWRAASIGITGSVGKTTTKDLLAGCLAFDVRHRGERAILQQRARPAADAAERARRCAAGSSSRWARAVPGTSSSWPQVARPDVGIVTSVAMAHVEYFGDLDGVARAKSELVAALPAVGRRRPQLRRPACAGHGRGRARARVLGYAVDADAEVRADDVTLDGELRARFTLDAHRGARATCAWRCTACSRCPTRSPRRPPRCGAVSPSRR